MMVMNWFLTPQGPATVSSLQAAFLVCWQMQSRRQISKTALYRPGHLRQGLFMSSQALWSCLPCFWGNRFSAGWWLSKQILSNLGSSAAGFLCPALLSPSSFSILALAQLCTNIACPKSTSFASTWLCSSSNRAGYTQCISGSQSVSDNSNIPFPFPSPAAFSSPVVSLLLAVPPRRGKDVNACYFGNGKTQRLSSPEKNTVLENKRRGYSYNLNSKTGE